jgi:phosphoribosylanthranilate isomerase
MKIAVKICGLRDQASVAAAVEGGADYLGFVFYDKSPRHVTAETAATLIKKIPFTTMSVGLLVDPRDDDIMNLLRATPLRALQLHGSESVQRVADIKRMTGLTIIKAVGIGSASDVAAARAYDPVTDILLLDAPAHNLPGGNAISFDWSLAKNAGLQKPWMLAGGLTADNIAAAVGASGARILDVSSGVEDAPGHKNPLKINEFLAKAHLLETCC